METRPTTIDSVSVTYDAFGRMVEQTKSGTSTEIEYSPTGFKLQLLNGQSSYLEQFEPLPGGTAKVWQGSGPDYYRHADWLGSSRFSSTPSRTMYNDLAYAPFGEQYAQTGTTGIANTSFAGNNEDTTTNLYDAQFREYEIYGRWPSPDPAGMAAASVRSTPALVPGTGRQDVESYCNTCHTPSYVTMQPPLPAATWKAEVDKMGKAFGAQIPAESQASILEYLDSHYTPETRKR